jgi:ferritin-like metal-binding protein YciE
MRDIATLNDLMVYYLQSLLDTELRWSEALDRTFVQVWSPELRRLLVKSADLSRNHLRILAETLEEFENGEAFRTALVVDGLIGEMDGVIRIATDSEVKDAAILVFHQSIGHYKIAQYGAVSSYAKLLKMQEIASTIHHLLEEEKAADEVLTELAETRINPDALSSLLK